MVLYGIQLQKKKKKNMNFERLFNGSKLHKFMRSRKLE